MKGMHKDSITNGAVRSQRPVLDSFPAQSSPVSDSYSECYHLYNHSVDQRRHFFHLNFWTSTLWTNKLSS